MHYYDVFPQIVPADKESVIRIHPRYEHAILRKDEIWQLEIYVSPADGVTANGIMPAYVWGSDDGEKLQWEFDENGDIIVRYFFAGEQEHNLQLVITRSDNPDYFVRRSVKLYSLKEDLFALRPYKGDTHLHTTRSDGKEEPHYVAGRYRQAGFDFIAVTDHRTYEPSVETKNFWQTSVPDFTIVPGEEVHAPDNPVHIVNFGGESGVNAIWQNQPERYRAEVAEYLEAMPADVPEEIRYAAASSYWVFDRIRQANGVAVFAHPYWTMARNVLPMPLVDELFKSRRFDAVEIVGGFYREQSFANNFQQARCFEEWAKGNRFPVVGASDSHGTELFPSNRFPLARFNGADTTRAVDGELYNWYYTIVFADANCCDSLRDAIKAGRCVAIEAANGDLPHLFGEVRLVRYASFLLREYFPVLTPLAKQQGDAMLDALAGDDSAWELLKLHKGRLDSRREKFFVG